MRKVIVGIIALVLLTGCGSGVVPPVPKSSFDVSITNGLMRVVDVEAGVICYIYTNISASSVGVSCIPMNQTRLDDNED